MLPHCRPASGVKRAKWLWLCKAVVGMQGFFFSLLIPPPIEVEATAAQYQPGNTKQYKKVSGSQEGVAKPCYESCGLRVGF